MKTLGTPGYTPPFIVKPSTFQILFASRDLLGRSDKPVLPNLPTMYWQEALLPMQDVRHFLGPKFREMFVKFMRHEDDPLVSYIDCAITLDALRMKAPYLEILLFERFLPFAQGQLNAKLVSTLGDLTVSGCLKAGRYSLQLKHSFE